MFKRVARKIGGIDCACGRAGQRDGQATAACAQIQGAALAVCRQLCEKIPAAFGQQFRFRARNQNVPADRQFQTAKGNRADNVLQRFALPAPPHQFAQRLRFPCAESARSKFRYKFIRGIFNTWASSNSTCRRGEATPFFPKKSALR